MQKLIPHEALNDTDVLTIANANGDCSEFILYNDLQGPPEVGRCFVILIRQKENFGHYVAMLNHGDSLEFYDSYAYKPDREKKWVSARVNESLGNTPNKVSDIMREWKDAGGKCEYNERKFQNEHNPKDSSCGYQVGIRCLNHRMSLTRYQQWLTKLCAAKGLTGSNAVIAMGKSILHNVGSGTDAFAPVGGQVAYGKQKRF